VEENRSLVESPVLHRQGQWAQVLFEDSDRMEDHQRIDQKQQKAKCWGGSLRFRRIQRGRAVGWLESRALSEVVQEVQDEVEEWQVV
jgi:hypothetical protein